MLLSVTPQKSLEGDDAPIRVDCRHAKRVKTEVVGIQEFI